MSWQEQALKLRCGSRRRVKHCKDDYSMLISHDLKCVRAFCFRCGFNGFSPHGVQRISDLLRRQQEYREQVSRTGLSLPEDYTLDTPPHAAAWYLKYGITHELAQMYDIGYSPDLDRIVMPIHEEGELTAIQMRAVRDDIKPKYLNPAAHGIDTVLFSSLEGKAKWGCVVEDNLSAIKVGSLLPTCSIMGTKMSDQRAYKLSEKFDNVILWFDNDPAGAAAYKKAGRSLSLLGTNVFSVHTEKDPKKYPRSEIKTILKGAHRGY